MTRTEGQAAGSSERPKRKLEDYVADGAARSSWDSMDEESGRGVHLRRGAETDEIEIDVSIVR